MTNKTRKILCFIISVFLTSGLVMFIISNGIGLTICSQKYMAHFIDNNSINVYCDKMYNERIEALSVESGIPSQVFAFAKTTDNHFDMLSSQIFDDEYTNLYNRGRIDNCEKVITDYLEGNNIKYDKASVRNTAEKATEIFADCYTIKNVHAVREFVKQTTISFARYGSVGIVISLVMSLTTMVMFNNKKKAVGYIARSVTATGLFIIIVSIGSLITGATKISTITTPVFAEAISHAIILMTIILMLIGIILISLSIPVSKSAFKLSDKTHS